MGPTEDLLSEGHMSNLAVQIVDGINRAVYCTVEQFREEGVATHFGKKALPVILANTKLAELILQGAHQGVLQFNHRKSEDAFTRSREVAYIYHATDLAKKICQECVLCIL